MQHCDSKSSIVQHSPAQSSVVYQTCSLLGQACDYHCCGLLLTPPSIALPVTLVSSTLTNAAAATREFQPAGAVHAIRSAASRAVIRSSCSWQQKDVRKGALSRLSDIRLRRTEQGKAESTGPFVVSGSNLDLKVSG